MHEFTYKEAKRVSFYETLGAIAIIGVSILFLYMIWTMKKIPEEAEKP